MPSGDDVGFFRQPIYMDNGVSMTKLEVNDLSQAQTINSPDIWMTYSFAPEWLADAKTEATKSHNHHSARRR